MKKSTSVIIGVIVVLVILIGGYAIFHKSSPKTSNSSSSTAAASTSSAILNTKTNATVGQYLATPADMALYTFGGDTTGVSNCTGSCLAAWPAYVDTGSTTNLPAGVGTITRTDNGQKQYTYNGMPLYTFASDTKGQVTGDHVSNFTVATPVKSTSSASSTSSTKASATNSSTSSSYNY